MRRYTVKIRPIAPILGIVFASTLLASCGTSSPHAAPAVAKNLVVTPSVRKSLLDAAARYHELPASDYMGLVAGATYYAFDPSTDKFFAAAGIVPSPHSLQAQIGAQDDGSYNLFVHRAHQSAWTVYNDGLGGAADGVCPFVIPSDVLKVWHWRAKSCYPPLGMPS
jgi:hypothetical protein